MSSLYEFILLDTGVISCHNLHMNSGGLAKTYFVKCRSPEYSFTSCLSDHTVAK